MHIASQQVNIEFRYEISRLVFYPVNDANGYAERERNGAGISDGRAKMVISTPLNFSKHI